MEKNNKKIDTNNMITLCHIVDEFDEFEKSLIPVISPKYNRDFVFQLWDVSQGKFKLGARKAKRFYEENKFQVNIFIFNGISVNVNRMFCGYDIYS